jgi:hypothetical protein
MVPRNKPQQKNGQEQARLKNIGEQRDHHGFLVLVHHQLRQSQTTAKTRTEATSIVGNGSTIEEVLIEKHTDFKQHTSTHQKQQVEQHSPATHHEISTTRNNRKMKIPLPKTPITKWTDAQK